MRKLLLLFLILIPASLFAQVNITGKVINSATKAPIVAASVFLSNSGVGDKTSKDGAFTLRNVKNGRYDLVVSCIGYLPYKSAITVNNESITVPDIGLTEKIEHLSEVKIKFQSKSDKEKYLLIFKKAFLGSSSNAGQCRIINPDVLDFDYSKKDQSLTASASDFLIIDNPSLGYRIKYLILSFKTDALSGVTNYIGSSVFEPMAGNALQQKVWQNKRAKVYFGSTMHFLRSCIADAVNENKFTVREVIKPEYRPSDSLIMRRISHFRNSTSIPERVDSLNYWMMMFKIPHFAASSINRVLNLNEYVKLTNEKGIYAFGHPSKAILINYRNRINVVDDNSSCVTFIQPNVFFDSNGVIFTPGDCLFEGYWQYLRVADQLPVDYELPQENATQQAETPDADDKLSH